MTQNTQRPLITDIGERQMLRKISGDVTAGFAITPFIGSGVSAASGILMGQQFNAFLSHALFESLQSGYSIIDRGWPPIPDTKQAEELMNSVKKWKRGNRGQNEPIIDDELTSKIRDKGMDLLSNFVNREGVKWYEVLGFLSQLRVALLNKDGSGENYLRLRLRESDATVIDSYNSYITRGRKPNLSHTMVARLARSLRSRIVLTTNFDTLLEESFAILKRKVQVFAVSSRGALPPFSTVYAQDSLVKLHGDILETRADETLNHSPGMEDLRRFFEYLRGPFESRGLSPEMEGFTPSNLIVLGYSGGDIRCMKMIEFVLDFDPSFQIYWICNSENTLKTVSNTFDLHRHGDRIHCAVIPRTDLFLYALYQKVNNSLPGGGFNYEFTHSTPPTTTLKGSAPNSREQRERISEQFKKACNGFSGGSIITIDRASDVMGPARYMFQQFEAQRKVCTWLDLDDYSSVRNLAFQILSILSLRQGFFQAEHVNLLPADTQPDDEEFGSYLGEIFGLLRIDPSDCWVFLYGRNAPGACAGFIGEFWGGPEYRKLRDMMKIWAEVGVNFVYMPLSQARFDRNLVKEDSVVTLLERLPRYQKNNSDARSDAERNAFKKQSGDEFELKECVKDLDIPENAIGGKFPLPSDDKQDFNTVIEHNLLENWLGFNLRNDPNVVQGALTNLEWPQLENMPPLFWKVRFLYALTLFRQSRHPAALVCEATIPCPKRFNLESADNDEARSTWADKWIADLSSHGVLLKKPGGYQWKYRDVRVGLRRILENITEIGENSGNGAYNHLDYLGQIRARTHFWIGDWYYKAFLSSGHFMPLIECIYHRIQTLKWVRFAKPKGLNLSDEDDFLHIKRYRIHLAHLAVTEAVKVARLGRRSLKFWLPGMEVRGFDTSVLREQSKQWWEAEKAPQYWDLFLDELVGLQKAMAAEGGRKKEERTYPRFAFPEMSEFFNDGTIDPLDAVKISIDEENIHEDDVLGKFRGQFQALDSIEEEDNQFITIIDSFLRDQAPGMPAKLSKWKVEWVRGENKDDSMIVNQERLIAMIWLMAELAYVLTKHSRYRDDIVIFKSGGHLADNKPRWAATSMVCATALDLLRNLHPALIDFELETKAKCLTIYGLSLGHLGRTTEAHRRFNEAHAVLSQTRRGLEGVSFAALNLRRAEVYTTSARDRLLGLERPYKPSDRRVCVSALNDAWSALELADESLAGISHSSTWWYRLHCNRLEVIALQAGLVKGERSLGLAFRRQGDMNEQLKMIESRLHCLSEWSENRKSSFEWRFEQAKKAVKEMASRAKKRKTNNAEVKAAQSS